MIAWAACIVCSAETEQMHVASMDDAEYTRMTVAFIEAHLHEGCVDVQLCAEPDDEGFA